MDDWKSELSSFAKAYKRNLPIPEICNYDDILNYNQEVSKAIYQVYLMCNKDSGEAIENLSVLRDVWIKDHIKKYYLGHISFVSMLMENKLEPMKVLQIIDDYNSKKKQALRDCVSTFEIIGDEDELLSDIKMIYHIKD